MGIGEARLPSNPPDDEKEQMRTIRKSLGVQCGHFLDARVSGDFVLESRIISCARRRWRAVQ